MFFNCSRRISCRYLRLLSSLTAAACIHLTLWGCAPLQSVRVESGIPVHFTYTDGRANRVSVAGSFNEWSMQSHPMHRQGNVWSLDVVLQPGRYQYAFVVDDCTWEPDPGAVLSEDTGFGTLDSVLIVE